MNLRLKRLAPLQAGKVLGAFYGLFSLLFLPFVLVFMAVGNFAARAHGESSSPAMPLLLGMGVGFMLVLPVFYAALGFVFGALGAWIYNGLVRWTGGFECEFEPTPPPCPPPLS